MRGQRSPDIASLIRATIFSTRVRPASARPGKRDLVEDACSEPFGRAGHRLAGEGAIKADGRLVVGERPDHETLQPALRQVTSCRGEELAAEAEALKLGAQIQLVDLTVIIQAAGAVATVVGIARDGLAEGKHGDAAALANGAVPPLRAAPVDQLVELGSGNDALVRPPPGFVMRRRNGRCI